MRIESIAALLVCLCVWIPAAQSQYSSSATPPEDEDSSGDDWEISGSGSGDEGSEIPKDSVPTEVSTLAITNTTKTAWVTDAPVKVPEPTATQLSSTVIPLADVETAAPTTKAPLLHTTKIPETSPSPSSVESLIHMKEVSGDETTTIHHVDLEDITTLPDEKLPVVSVTERSTITTPPVDVEEETTVFVVLDTEEDGAINPVVVVDQSTDAPDMETTILPLTTTSAKEVADPEASGDAVESTTIRATVDDGLIEENVIPDVNRETYTQIPDSDDFHFENEIRPNSRANRPQSEVSLGASSEDGSLLERTEVLAGVIAGGLVGLAFAIMLVALMVYRMKKKDEGSYSLDEHKHPNGGYQKPVAQEEFLA
ncbi:hypothetical protein AOLI_G00120370 [Acnodon oligacanthus]